MPNIVCNKIRTPDGKVLESFHRHDYKTHLDKNGTTYGVDGGHEYLKRIGGRDYTDLSLYDDADHETIREHFCWGVRGAYGKQAVLYTPLANLSDGHIEAILDTQLHIAPHIQAIFLNELDYRKRDSIEVDDE